MAAVLSATHLLRRFALFAMTVLFLLTMLRAGHALWHYEVLASRGVAIDLFVRGLWIDLGLIALLLFPVVVLVPLLAIMNGAGRIAARILMVAVLTAALVGVLLAEYITPSVLLLEGVRPDPGVLAALDDAPGTILASLRAAPLPALLGAVLIALITIAFISRLDTRRLLAFRLATVSGLLLSVIGGVLCATMVWFAALGPGVDPEADAAADPESPTDSPTDSAALLQELSLNTAWKVLYAPLVKPALSVFNSDPSP